MKVGGIGIGGLKYLNGADDVDKIKRRSYLRANTETLKDGIGFYLRDDEGNYMLLIRNDELLSISFDKEPDRIKEKDSFSIFRACLEKGISYHWAKYMLMEEEIEKLNPPMLKIITTNLYEINFEVSRRNPLKVNEYFKSSPFADKYSEDYQTFEVVT